MRMISRNHRSYAILFYLGHISRYQPCASPNLPVTAPGQVRGALKASLLRDGAGTTDPGFHVSSGCQRSGPTATGGVAFSVHLSSNRAKGSERHMQIKGDVTDRGAAKLHRAVLAVKRNFNQVLVLDGGTTRVSETGIVGRTRNWYVVPEYFNMID